MLTNVYRFVALEKGSKVDTTLLLLSLSKLHLVLVSQQVKKGDSFRCPHQHMNAQAIIQKIIP